MDAKNTGAKVKQGKKGVIKLAQLADIHVDPMYAIVSEIWCCAFSLITQKRLTLQIQC